MGDSVKRLAQFLNHKGIAFYKAEIDCGLSNGLIGKAVNSGTSLRTDSLEKILNTYTDLSAEWLLRGTGSMIIGDNINLVGLFEKNGMPANSDKIISTWKKMMECQKEMTDLFESYSSESAVRNPCNDNKK